MPKLREVRYICDDCKTECFDQADLDQHRANVHPSTEDDIARNLLGAESLSDAESRIASKLSTGQKTNGEDRQQETQSREELAEERKRRKMALEKIGGAICRKAASMPYYVWAGMAGNPEYKLTKQEQDELTEAYLEICKGYNADFTSPIFGVIAAIAINSEIVAKRLGIETQPERMVQ